MTFHQTEALYSFQNRAIIMFNQLFRKDKAAQDKAKEQMKQQYFQEERTELPANFAQTVMDLEMQLEFVETFNMELVHKLNELYRIAIQYYVNEDPRKVNHFQKKLNSLLTHPYTLQLIEKKPAPAKAPEVDPAHYSSQLRIQLNKFNTQSEIVVKSMIEGSNKKVEKSSRLMSQNIESQEERLKRRMEQRSRSKKKPTPTDE